MDDRLFYPLIALIALGLVALAAVWPQGLGDRSPGPWGHTPVQQTPEMREALARERARAVLERATRDAAADNAEEEAAASVGAGELR